jgi:hypothetical protein
VVDFAVLLTLLVDRGDFRRRHRLRDVGADQNSPGSAGTSLSFNSARQADG